MKHEFFKDESTNQETKVGQRTNTQLNEEIFKNLLEYKKVSKLKQAATTLLVRNFIGNIGI